MMRRSELARLGAQAAIDVRRRLQIDRAAPLCPFDAAERLGIQVRLMSLPSVEGIYCSDRGPTIIVSTERPPGRQAFTCAHELAHYEFGHGTRSDEYLAKRTQKPVFEPEEFVADVFAGHLLMPAGAVREGFANRGVSAETATPLDVFATAGWLGVGYDTLVLHLQVGLQLVSSTKSGQLRRWTPKDFRRSLLIEESVPYVVVAGPAWSHRPIDLRVGDGVLLPEGAINEGGKLALRPAASGQVLAVALQPGIARVEIPTARWCCFVRVAKQNYEGLSRFRFEEDYDDEHGASSDDC